MHVLAICCRAMISMFAAAALPAAAETSAVWRTGFTTSFRAQVNATPAAVYQAMTRLPRWWNSQHTWSGQASNMSLDLAAGGCWCERWGAGQSVMHGQVALVQPGRVISLLAQLGPLLELPVSGVLTIVTSAQDGKTFFRITYRVSGPPDAGLEALAPAVDRVIGEQFGRLKAYAETGRPG